MSNKTNFPILWHLIVAALASKCLRQGDEVVQVLRCGGVSVEAEWGVRWWRCYRHIQPPSGLPGVAAAHNHHQVPALALTSASASAQHWTECRHFSIMSHLKPSRVSDLVTVPVLCGLLGCWAAPVPPHSTHPPPIPVIYCNLSVRLPHCHGPAQLPTCSGGWWNTIPCVLSVQHTVRQPGGAGWQMDDWKSLPAGGIIQIQCSVLLGPHTQTTSSVKTWWDSGYFPDIHQVCFRYVFSGQFCYPSHEYRGGTVM